jgi:hypothetical protein
MTITDARLLGDDEATFIAAVRSGDAARFALLTERYRRGLQPYPDRMLPEDPQESVVARETIELAFIVAVQHLPPRRRAVLILRDVLGWPASKAADALELTVASVTSALQRARVTIREQLPDRRLDWRSPATDELSNHERGAVKSYIDAHERNDLDGLMSLLRDDLRFAMLPEPGTVTTTARDAVDGWVSGGLFQRGHDDWRGITTAVNRMPAAVLYLRTPPTTRSTGYLRSRSCTSSTGRSPSSPASTPPTNHGWACPRHCDHTRSSDPAELAPRLAEHQRDDANTTTGAHRLVSYRVSTMPQGNVRVSTRFRFTQLSRVVKNGVPPPTKTGAVANTYSSISPARIAAAASVAPPMSIGPPSSALSRVISATASPVTRRVFQSTVLIVEEKTTFGMSRQRRANSICAGLAPGCWSAVGQWELIVSHSLRPYSARPVAPTRSDHHWNSSSLGTPQPMSSPGAAM